jgi:hypothetical protein
MKVKVGIVSLLIVAGTGVAMADHVYQLTELEGVYPPEQSMLLTFPADMSGVGNMAATLTHTGHAGLRQCPEQAEPTEYTLPFYLSFSVEYQGTTYSFGAAFSSSWNPGSPVTETSLLDGLNIQVLQGQTVEITAGPPPQGGCEIFEPATLDVHGLQLQLIGDVVATRASTLSSIKALFD